MDFVTRGSFPFTNLSNSKTSLIKNLEHPIIISGIIVCNTTGSDIRVSFKRKVNGIEFFTTKSIRVGLSGNYDFCSINPDPDNIKISQGFRQYSFNPENEIYVYSDGSAQRFDLEIIYSQLNELPELE